MLFHTKVDVIMHPFVFFIQPYLIHRIISHIFLVPRLRVSPLTDNHKRYLLEVTIKVIVCL